MDNSYELKNFQKTLPSKLISTGVFIIILSVVTLFGIAYLLRYSDIVSGNITLTTSDLPLEVISKEAGTVHFLIEDESIVKKNQAIALLDKEATYEAILEMKNLLNTNKSPIEQAKKLSAFPTTALGAVQEELSQLHKAYNNYDNFSSADQQIALTNSKRKSIRLYRDRLELLEEKSKLSKEDVRLAEKQAKSKERLAESKTIAEAEFERSLQTKISKEFANLSNSEAINAIKIQITQLEQEIIESESQHQELEQNYRDAIQRELSTLRNEIQNWKNKYLLVANRTGKCIWSEYLVDGNFVSAEQVVCTITPEKETDPIGRMEISMKGAAKVKIGQKVNILLENYPPNEFGILKGTVRQISNLPENGFLKVDVTLPDTLTSTYGFLFDFQQLATGRAEIITNKMSFLERIWNEAKGITLNQSS